MQLADLGEFSVALIAIKHGAIHREIGRVDLQNESGFRNRPVFVVHLARDCCQIILL